MIPAEWSAYNTQVSGGLEVVPWVFWDTATYTSATTTSMTLFNAVRATTDLGNLQIASALPNPYAFLVRGVRFFQKGVVFDTNQAATATAQTGAFSDVVLLCNTGVFEFTIGNKTEFQAPLWMITAGGGAFGQMANAGATAANIIAQYAQNGVPDPRAANSLSKPLVIDSVINFKVVLSWPAGAVTLAAGNPALCVALDGELSRPIQ